MSTTSKLTYLNYTKDLFKDKLNSLGAEITSSTTFRNYLNWLDKFYGEVSDKTDLSQNGVVGRTSQSELPNPNNQQTVNNLTGNVTYTITANGDIKIFTIPLGDIELCNIDTYEDKIYSSDGKFYLNKNIKKISLTGQEEGWETVQAYNKNYPSISVENMVISTAATNESLLYSNYYQGHKVSEIASNNPVDYGVGRRSNKSYLLFRNKDTSDLAQFKTWLSTHNTIIYYPLATPITTEITANNYPELYAVLKEIQDYLTSYKINKEFILGYSSPNIEY